MIAGLTRRLPPALGVPLAGVAGNAEWALSPARRRASRRHLDRALRGTAREAEVPRLVRRQVAEARICDLLTWRPDAGLHGTITGVEKLDALRAGGGALVLHTHLCSIAPTVYVLSSHGYCDAIVLNLDDPLTPLQELYAEWLRDRWGTELVGVGGSYGLLVERLAGGRLVNIAGDVPGNLPCTLLGKPAHLAGGPARLAIAAGAPLIPVIPRRRGARLEVTVRDPIDPAGFADEVALTSHIADVLGPEIERQIETWQEHDWLERMWA